MPERRLLVHQLDAQEVYMDGRSELDKRRLAQETEVEAERGRKYKAKLTTRGDVMAIIELYNTHKILPLAARLDAAEGALHYLTAPWYWLVRSIVRMQSVEQVLDAGELREVALAGFLHRLDGDGVGD